jgi:hypothetical protein
MGQAKAQADNGAVKWWTVATLLGWVRMGGERVGER